MANDWFDQNAPGEGDWFSKNSPSSVTEAPKTPSIAEQYGGPTGEELNALAAPNAAEHPILQNAATGLVEAAKGFVPKSPREAAAFAEQGTPAPHVLSTLTDVLFGGKPIKQAIIENAGIGTDPITGTVEAIRAAEQTPAYSAERFKAGFGTIGQLLMAAGIGKEIAKAHPLPLNEALFPKPAEPPPLPFTDNPDVLRAREAAAAAQPVKPEEVTPSAQEPNRQASPATPVEVQPVIPQTKGEIQAGDQGNAPAQEVVPPVAVTQPEGGEPPVQAVAASPEPSAAAETKPAEAVPAEQAKPAEPPPLPAPQRPEPPPASPAELDQTVQMKMPGSEGTVTRIKNGLLSLVLPTMKSPEHLQAAETLGSKLGAMNRRSESGAFALSAPEKAFTKLGVDREGVPPMENEGAKFASALATGGKVEPKFQEAAATVQKLFQNRLQELEKAGVGLDQVREHYFPGMWTKESIAAFNDAMSRAQDAGIIPKEGFDVNAATPEQKAWVRAKVEENLANGVGSENDQLRYLSKRPFKGKESFRKPKVFDDVMDAMEFGLRPVSNNPITLVKLKLAEMDRSIMANQALRDWEKSGDVANFNNSGEPLKSSLRESYNPNEWVKIDDPYGTIWHRDPETHLLEKIGERRAKAPVAEILNNYLSSSLYNSRYFGDLYKAWMGTASALNQSQLGMGSAFHAGFTTYDVQQSAMALVLKDMYGVIRGNRSVADLGRSLGRASVAMVRNPIVGDAVLNAWRDPEGRMTPKVEQTVKAMELGGGGLQLERGFMTQQATKLASDWYSGHKLLAAARSPIAATEMMARPIMKFLVPRQKAGVFAELAGRIIEQNPGKSLEELAPAFRQAWNRVDARLGQVQYDRLFMNNVAKNLVQGTVRAPGWTGGTIGEVGGAFKDAYNFFREWVRTGKPPEELPDRVAYTTSLLLSTMVVNGALTYAFTGQKPHGMDFFAFRDGGRDENGNETRLLIPSYVKDMLAYAESPLGTIGAKTHPMLSVLNDVVAKNQDYYGVQIRDPDAPYYKQAGQAAGYVAKAFEPFWTRGARKELQLGAGPGHAVAAYFGVMPAPKRIIETPAMKLMSEIMRAKRPVGGYTKAQAERREQKREASKGVDMRPELFKRLSKEDRARVLEVATPEERTIFESATTGKRGSKPFAIRKSR